MQLTRFASPIARVKRELPPSAPLPATLQTLACRLCPLAYLERCRARYGSRFTVYPIDMSPLVFLSDPQDIKALLAAPPVALRPGAGGAVVTPLFGERSFVLREEAEHKCGRHAILPAFQRKAMREQVGMIEEQVQREVASWPLDAAFPIHPQLGALTLRVILRVVFSGEDRMREELHGRMLRMLAAMGSPILQEPRLRYLPGWHGTWKHLMREREEVDRLVFSLIRARRGGGDRDDTLQMLLAARNPDGSPMSDRQIRDNFGLRADRRTRDDGIGACLGLPAVGAQRDGAGSSGRGARRRGR